MSELASTIEELAEMGANLELTKDCGLRAPAIEQIVQTATARGGHVTIDARLLLAPTLVVVAKIGGNQVTIRV